MFVAPLAPVVAWLYFLPAYPLYARILLCVAKRPRVDTRGHLWEAAVLYQTIGVLVAQFILFGLVSLRQSIEAAVLVAIAFCYTLIRAVHMPSLARRSHSMRMRRRAGGQRSPSAYLPQEPSPDPNPNPNPNPNPEFEP